MSAKNADIGTVLTPAALIRLRRVAEATPDVDMLDGPIDGEDGALAALGDRWVEAARDIQLITKDVQYTQQVLTAALNRATRACTTPKVREVDRES